MAQPKYDVKPLKILARKNLVDFYQRHSGKKAISKDRQFWSLCSTQSRLKTSEINQLVGLGVIDKPQYYGVDWDSRKIAGNVRKHPDAHWICGDWESVIKENVKIFNPEVVFLDFTSMAGTEKILSATQRTLCRCPPGTYLFTNVMLNNPRDPSVFFTFETFPQRLMEYTNSLDWEGWTAFYSNDLKKMKNLPVASVSGKGILCYPYSCTGYTIMAMYPFWKAN